MIEATDWVWPYFSTGRGSAVSPGGWQRNSGGDRTSSQNSFPQRNPDGHGGPGGRNEPRSFMSEGGIDYFGLAVVFGVFGRAWLPALCRRFSCGSWSVGRGL